MAEKNSARKTDRQTDRHYENNGHLAVNQLRWCVIITQFVFNLRHIFPRQWQ